MNNLTDLYHRDFHAWTLKAAELIRQGQLNALNLEELAEELDSLGRKERHEIANRLVILLAHLLKWHFQPAYRSGSWRSSIIEQRKQMQRLLQQSPSLKPYVPAAIAEAYPDAVDLASRETLLPPDSFPGQCRYSPAELLDYAFYPEATSLEQ